MKNKVKQGGITHKNSCRRQVFSTKEVAETTAKALRRLDILAKPERCVFCGLMHLEELRKK